MTTLFIAECQEIFRRGLLAVLAETEFTVADEAARPDIVLVAETPGDREAFFEEIAALRHRFPKPPVVAMLDAAAPTAIERASQAGATHFVLKSATETQFLEILRAARADESETLPGVWTQLSSSPQQQEEPLTWRESQVLALITRGLGNKQIAAELGISTETAKEHVQNILRKLRAENRTQAAVLAVRRGF